MLKRATPRPVVGLILIATLALATGGCGDSASDPGDAGPPDASPVGFETYDPWMVMDSAELDPVRGWTILRGIVHCHSPYSHDACDGEPRIEGERNEECFHDVRRGMCETAQDFVFMTDHDDLYAEYDYPEVLLYADGDELILRNDLPVANRINCGDGRQVILAAGTESAMMPIGIEHHLGDTLQDRMDAYNTVSATAIYSLQDAGALVFLQHTEEWDATDVLGLPIDGIEIYNLHYNMMDNLSLVLQLALDLELNPEGMGEPELGLLPVFAENGPDLEHWSRAVMQRRMVGVLATDAHQNVAPNPVTDGERLDSFRRIMRWFSNYVLVPGGPVDDLVLKEAIAHGRLFGGFDYLGYPVGFDFRAETAAAVYEMGDQVPAGETTTLHVEIPQVWRVHPYREQPEIHGRLLRADDGAWIEVAASTEAIVHDALPGAYRTEIWITPHHLRSWAGADPDLWISERPWIYSNVIYVGTELPER